MFHDEKAAAPLPHLVTPLKLVEFRNLLNCFKEFSLKKSVLSLKIEHLSDHESTPLKMFIQAVYTFVDLPQQKLKLFFIF